MIKRHARQTKEFTPGVIVLWNKSDIVTDDSHENVFPEWKTIIISAVSNKGLLNLHEALANYLIPSNGKQEERQDELTTNLRHRNALRGTVQNLEMAKVNVENGIGNEFKIQISNLRFYIQKAGLKIEW